MKKSVLFSSKSPHWPTPKALLEELEHEFHFDFDPCPLGETEKDGSAPLFSSWAGKRVFCNPPYNRGIARFLERAHEAAVAVFLLPARTDTKWFHDIVLPNASEIRFIKGRLHFGEAKKSAPFPSMLAIFMRINQSSPLPKKLPDITMNEWQKAVECSVNAANDRQPAVPKDWITCREIACMFQKSYAHSSRLLRTLIAEGQVESRKFVIRSGDRMVPVPHYRLIKKE